MLKTNYKKVKLLSHQQPIFKKVLKMLEEKDHIAAVVLPMGLGKTYIAAAAIEVYGYTLWITNHIALYEEQMEDLAAHQYSFIKDKSECMTYTGVSMFKTPQRTPKLIVIDEYHHSGAPIWGKGIENIRTIYPEVPILAMSATPFRPNDYLKDDDLFNILNRRKASDMQVWDAWANPEVPMDPPNIVSAIYDWVPIKDKAKADIEKIRDGRKKALIAEDYKTLCRNIDRAENMPAVFQKFLKKDGHYIFFCSNLDHLQSMQNASREWFSAVNPRVKYYSISYLVKNPFSVIKEYQEHEDGVLKVIFVVDMMNEGYHVRCDGVIFGRPTESMNVMLQQMGRAMSTENNSGLVLDLVNNLDSRFSVWKNIEREYSLACERYGVKKEDRRKFRIICLHREATEVANNLQKKLLMMRSLEESFPELAKEWHPTKNNGITPAMVLSGSEKEVWWLGKCGHEWKTSIHNRTSGNNCPYCSGRRILAGFNDLATVHPDLAKEWHPKKNEDLTPQMVTPGCHKKVWWLGKCGHTWESQVSHRTSNKNGCPYCSGRKILIGFNDLQTLNPELALEWHSEKNGDLSPQMVTLGSSKKVWWLGKCGHEWQATVKHRARLGRGCPYCSGKKRRSFEP